MFSCPDCWDNPCTCVGGRLTRVYEAKSIVRKLEELPAGKRAAACKLLELVLDEYIKQAG